MEQKITIKIGDGLEMSLSEARELWEQLNKIFGVKELTDVYPTYPFVPYRDKIEDPWTKLPYTPPQIWCQDTSQEWHDGIPCGNKLPPASVSNIKQNL